MKKAVIFDIGGVLFSPPQWAIAAYEKELGVPRGMIAYVFLHGAPDNAFCRLERGELTLSQFIPEFEKECATLAKKRGVAFLEGFSARELFKRIAVGKPIPEMISAVEHLRQLGYKTCALTNNWIDDISDRSDKVDHYLSLMFDVVLQSCKLGMRKPDPKIFKLACEKLETPPEQVVFLDDLGVNVKAARKLGLTTIKVVEPEKALAELEQALGGSVSLAAGHRHTSTPPRGRTRSKL